jgi:hypothetical protein
MHPGRILGIIMGLVILATIFLIPFDSSSNTLYGIVGPSINNLGKIQSSGDVAATTYAYIWIIAFIILVIAGVVGVFPLGTGVLGVVGMIMITISAYIAYPNGPVALSTGAGYFVIWAASIISLGASFWHGKRKPDVVVQTNVITAPPQQNAPAVVVNPTFTVTQSQGGAQQPSQTQTTQPPPSPATYSTSTGLCPVCGTQNPPTANFCAKCRTQLRQA